MLKQESSGCSERRQRSMRLGPGLGGRMLDQWRDGDFHIRIERKRADIGMQLLEAVCFPYAEIGDLPDDAPDAPKLVRLYQLYGAVGLTPSQVVLVLLRQV